MEYEKVLSQIGEFGRYQRCLCVLGLLLYVCGCFDNMSYVFVSARPDHWCAVPPLERLNLTLKERKKIALPPEGSPGLRGHGYSSCRMYDLPYDNMTLNEALDLLHSNHTLTDTTGCHYGWDYDSYQYQTTTVSEWDLVCSRRVMATTTQSVYMAGMMVGVFLSGTLADSIGRRKTIMICIVLNIIASIITTFSVNYVMFTCLRFFVAMSSVSSQTVFLVLALELVGSRRRRDVSVLLDIFWDLGYLLLDGVAYAFRRWRHLQLVLSLPLVLNLTLIGFLVESPRWLLTKNRIEDAKREISKMAHTNKKMVPDTDVMVKGCGRQVFLWDVLRYSRLRVRALCVYFLWFTNSIVYYGLSLNAPTIGNNAYVSFAASGAVEWPAYVVNWFLLNRWGRRPTSSSSLFLAGVALLLTMAVPDHKAYTWVLLSLTLLGKFAICVAYSALIVHTAELFPTVVRTSGIGSAKVAAKIGGMLAPQMALLAETKDYIPLVIFGSLSVTAGFLAQFALPETNNLDLPETLDDGEGVIRRDESPSSDVDILTT